MFRLDRRSAISAGVILVVLAVAFGAIARPFQAAPPWWTDSAAIQRGAHDVAISSCISCHALAGVANSTAARDLTHEGSRRSIAWLLHELAHPTSQRPPIPPGQIHDIAAYMESLR